MALHDADRRALAEMASRAETDEERDTLARMAGTEQENRVRSIVDEIHRRTGIR